MRDVVAYICKEYKKKEHLSKPRLTKMVYLVDWLSALRTGKQTTEIKWFYNHYGPFVFDVSDLVRKDDDFSWAMYSNHPWPVARFNGDDGAVNLDDKTREFADIVMSKTKNMEWPEFLDLVYQTYPVASKSKYSTLDLEEIAKEAWKSS